MSKYPTPIGRTSSTRGPVIEITVDAHRKLMAYVNGLSVEISGLGMVERISQRLLRVTDVMILPQVSSSAHTDIDEGAIMDLLGDMLDRGDDPGRLKLWWHSHADMGVFWSSTDSATISRLAESGQWFISIVANHEGQLLARLDIVDHVSVTIDDLPLQIVYPDDPEYTSEILDEIQANVKIEVSVKNANGQYDAVRVGTVRDGKRIRPQGPRIPVFYYGIGSSSDGKKTPVSEEAEDDGASNPT